MTTSSDDKNDPITVVRVDFGAAQRIMHVGVRRAAGFMLVGITAAENAEIGKSAFDPETKKFRWRYFPEDMNGEMIEAVQNNFKKWVVECGLRELDQHCSLFCDKIYELLIILEFHEGRVPQAAIDRIQSFLARTSVGKKLQTLEDEFGIVSKLREHIASMTLARNCLAHSMGHVTKRNSNVEDGLLLSWNVPNMYIGDVMITDEMLPFMVEKEQIVSIKFEAKQKLVKFGERINLTEDDLLGICWNYEAQTDQIAIAVEARFKERGIGPEKKETDPTPVDSTPS